MIPVSLPESSGIDSDGVQFDRGISCPHVHAVDPAGVRHEIRR
jgi:hypothetical protein